MKSKGNRKRNYILCVLCFAIFSLAGYFYISSSPMEKELEDTWADYGFLKIGKHLTIQNADNVLTLLDNKDVLSASGMYYAAWTMGSSEIFENGEGENVNLYDAQLYLVLGEYKSGEEAEKNMTKWLEAARGNYQILKKEEITCNGQPYILITYTCPGNQNPYDRGVSAFGVHEDVAVCMELTCLEAFHEDIRSILTNFLEHCSYVGKQD